MSDLNGSNTITNSGIGAQILVETGGPTENSTTFLDNIPNPFNLTNDIISSDNSSSNSTSSNSQTNATSLGFCHSCNKQNQINIEAYTCSQCNSGFIEVFNMDNDPHNEPSNNNSISSSRSDLLTSASSRATQRPIDRLIDRPAEIINDVERMNSRNNIGSTANGAASNNSSFFVINSSDMNSARAQNEQGEEISSLSQHLPLFQLIRRLNTRRTRASNIINNELSSSETTTTTTTTTAPPVEISLSSDSDTNNEWSSISSITTPAPTPAPTSPGTSFSNFNRAHRSSHFHYRLRRHAHGSSSWRDSESHRITGREPEARYRIPMHHRYHRPSPSTSRFHFSSLDNDDLFMNEHGAVIFTLINQLRNTNRGAAPASDTQISNLPNLDIDQAHVDKISQCAVCMDDFLLNENVKKLPCNHLYHDPCIDQWLKLHATCPICRKNINGDEPSDQDNQSNNPEGIPHPTLLNIFPLNSNLITNRTIQTNQNNNLDPLNLNPIREAQVASAQLDNNNNISNTTSNNSSNNSVTNQRRNQLRNRHLYRIQIRQALNNASSNSTSNSSSPSSNNFHQISLGLDDRDAGNLSERDLLMRQRRLGDTVAHSMALQERQSGVRATAVLINPQWNNSSHSNSTTTNTPTTTDALNSETAGSADLNPVSAFSLMNGYRDFRRRPISDTHRIRPTATVTTSNTAINGNSRISQMMDRLLSRYRLPNDQNQSNNNTYTNNETENNPSTRINTSITINNRPINDQYNESRRNLLESRTVNTVSSPPSISLRLGQLFRPNRHLQNQQNGENSTTELSESTHNQNEISSNRNNGNSDIYEIFRLEPPNINSNNNNTARNNQSNSIRNPISQDILDASDIGNDEEVILSNDETNEAFTENPNNYFDFSLFNRSQSTIENRNQLLLDRLFDIPENTQEINSPSSDDDIIDLDEDSPESSPDEGVPELISSQSNQSDPITITLDDSDFERQYSDSSERNRNLSDLDSNDLGTNSGVPSAKKRKTEST